MLPLILVAAVVAATLALTYGRGSFDLDRSAIGFEGLVAWLSKTGAEARTFIGGDRLTRERVGLRVYPLYDVGLGGQSANSAPRADPPPLFYGREVELGVVRTKIAALPTLIVLPKWRREVVDRGVVHPKLLIPQELIGRLAAAVAPDAGPLLPRAEGFLSLALDGGALRLYAGQLVRAGGCNPLIGTSAAMLLGRCMSGKTAYWLLADPDLIDNHGLTQGANARTTAEILPRLAGGRPVILDLTTTATFDEAPRRQQRSWSELLRFFGPPFTVVWAGLALLVGLVLWRAWIRMGPIEAAPDDRLRASREVSIDARARLLRVSGHDVRLVRVYAADRLQSLAEAVFGRRRALAGDAFHEVSQLLLRRAPALAAPFAEAFRRDRDGAANETELLRRVDDLATVSERIRDEFGRTARPRATRPG